MHLSSQSILNVSRNNGSRGEACGFRVCDKGQLTWSREIKKGLSGKKTAELISERLGVPWAKGCSVDQKNGMCKGPVVESSILILRN